MNKKNEALQQRLLCIQCGLTEHKSNACPKMLKAHQKILRFLKKQGGERITKLVPKPKIFSKWTKKNLIQYFSNKHELSGSWYPKLTFEY